MEVKINREIRDYTEAMFFGLSLRQFFFSVMACGVAVAVYFLLKPALGLETVSWVCIIAAVPFAAIGFLKYNGMTAEKFLLAWICSEILMPKRLMFGNSNMYWMLLNDTKTSGKKYSEKTESKPDKSHKNTKRGRRRKKG